MRLISQDGDLDMPYENIILTRNGGVIYAHMDANSRGNLMAEYSSEELAIRAMKKVHNAYGNGLFAVFRFPSEEEMNKPQNSMSWADLPWNAVGGKDEE